MSKHTWHNFQSARFDHGWHEESEITDGPAHSAAAAAARPVIPATTTACSELQDAEARYGADMRSCPCRFRRIQAVHRCDVGYVSARDRGRGTYQSDPWSEVGFHDVPISYDASRLKHGMFKKHLLAPCVCFSILSPRRTVGMYCTCFHRNMRARQLTPYGVSTPVHQRQCPGMAMWTSGCGRVG